VPNVIKTPAIQLIVYFDVSIFTSISARWDNYYIQHLAPRALELIKKYMITNAIFVVLALDLDQSSRTIINTRDRKETLKTKFGTYC
jgi:hypothetical protein